MQSSRSELKTGKRPNPQQIRSFKDGEVLFTEGSTGRELFIIHEGEVGVYREGAEGRVELARIECGGLIGEMSLLDALPRSATVVAKGDMKALVIGYMQFQSVMQSIPVWLQSIIKIVVSRLRDANRRVDQPIVRDRERGIVALIFLLHPVFSREVTGRQMLPFDTVVNEACFICRLRRKEVVHLLEQFEKRTVISLSEHDGKKYLAIPDIEVLHLYEEYLVLRSQKKTFRELGVPQETIAVLSNIAYVAQKRGSETAEGTHLAKKLLVEDLSLKDTAQLDVHLTDLTRRGLITMVPDGSGHTIIFHKETLGRIKKIKEWMPRFSMEVQ